MTYRFLLFSEEVENFVMEIKAPSSATFHELQTLIQNSCGYTEDDNHMFLICNEAWKVKDKVYLRDTDSMGMDEDLYLMDNTILEDFIEGNGQHIAYVYNMCDKKTLLLEMVEEIFGEKTDKPIVSRRKGTPPVQFEVMEEIVLPVSSPVVPANDDPDSLDADDSGVFSEDELDMEGFEVNEM